MTRLFKFFLILAFPICLASCGGSDDKAKPAPGGCSDQVLSDLQEVISLCTVNMDVEENKTLCLETAQDYVAVYPEVSCELENSNQIYTFDKNYIEQEFIQPLQKTEEETIPPGFWD